MKHPDVERRCNGPRFATLDRSVSSKVAPKGRLVLPSETSSDDRLELVGTVVGLWRYPVKSMAGEALSRAAIDWHGLAGDRRWAFIRPGRVESGFPWLTIREKPDLWHYRPQVIQPERPDGSPVVVTTPSGESRHVTDEALAAELGAGVRLMKQDRGVYDTLPLSLITLQTLATLESLTDLDLDVRRFRPNLVIDAVGELDYPEEAWVGRTLRLGDAAMRVDQRDNRCVMVNIDPDTTKSNPQILRTIARQRGNRLGVYGSTVTPGPVAVGGPVWLQG